LAITREKKEQIVAKYVELLGNSSAIVFVYMRHVAVNQVTQLRAKIRETGAGYRVVKNTLFKLALTQAGMPMPDAFDGPVAVAFCTEDIAPTVKAIDDFGNSLGDEEFEIIGGIVGQDVLDAKSAKALADLPSRDMLFAQVLAGIGAPANQLAGVVASGIRQVVYAIQARVDQLKEQEAA
jgi:large subunit ribosomal protein L10